MLSILVQYVPAVGSFVLPVANVLDKVSIRHCWGHLDTPAQHGESCTSDGSPRVSLPVDHFIVFVLLQHFYNRKLSVPFPPHIEISEHLKNCRNTVSLGSLDTLANSTTSANSTSFGYKSNSISPWYKAG